MKVLLTGAGGQLGQALQRSLADHELLPTTVSTLDITDQSQVNQWLQREQPELIINTAAYTQVDKAEEAIEDAYRVNEQGAAYLAQAANDLAVPIVHISTDYVFDGSSKTEWLESDLPHPLSVYGKSKLAGEQAVQQATPKHYIVRTAWLNHYSGQNFLTREFYRQLGIDTRVVPVSTDEFPRPAPRPKSSVLATERNTGIILPNWKDGVARLAGEISQSGW